MTYSGSVRRGGARALLGAVCATLSLVCAGAGLEPAPDFALKSTAGPNLRLSEYRGEVVMIAFWASWCGECRNELKAMGELAERYASVGFELLSVNLDSDMSRARESAESLDLDFPVLHDASGTVGELYGVDHLPLIALIDREGNLRKVLGGKGGLDREEYTNALRDLLRE